MMKPFSRSSKRGGVRPSPTFYVVVLSMFLWALIFSLHCSTSLQSGDAIKPPAIFSFRFGRPDQCAGRYVYMYDLPPRFNTDLARDCRRLSASTDMCKHVANDHFSAGFDAAMNQDNSDLTVRDALPQDMADWLARPPEWRAMGGRDHFMLVGRCTWDFLRGPDGGWGNALMTYPAIRNMTVLSVKASPWHGNDFAVPFPSHFHPSSDAEVIAWQHRMRRLERQRLWCFAGYSQPSSKRTVRAQIMEQCGRSRRYAILGEAAASATTTLGNYWPGHAMRLLESAEFCLQPRGDGFTRKSTFDAILAGCIPVFFHPVSVYLQYMWHLPREYRSYSVFIPRDDLVGQNLSIEEVLRKIPSEKVVRMREEVIRLIPTVMYRDAAAKRMQFKDAFDVAIERVIDRVAKRRRAVAEGREYHDSVDGDYS
ncbi:hypothetical protein ACQ4PT_045117 [Festuca glaucescens]